jgi:hypothetical protein
VAIIRNSVESSTVEYFLEHVSPYFEVNQEVWGTHINGKRKRIDVVLYPKPNLVESNFPQMPIGVEIKTEKLEDGNKRQIIELYRQTISYRHTRFELDGSRHFLPLILIYPPMSNYLKHVTKEFADGFQYLGTRLSGQFFIGELLLPRDVPEARFMIKVSGTEYFRMRNDGTSHRWNSNWGFEAYAREKEKLLQANLSPEEYDREIFSLIEMLGI